MKARILVVDDERGIRLLLKIAFTQAGYEVDTAADAMEAMALCGSQSFDALISDVQMPSVNGHELVRWVAEHYPATRCVLMTAYDDVDCRDCPAKRGCRILAKPFTPKQAVSVVEQILNEPPKR
jgi:DNA-binding NtrC family response regulator